MSENFNWEGYQAAISALVPNTTAEKKDPTVELLERTAELNEKRETLISLRRRLTRSIASKSEDLTARVDELAVIYNEVTEGLAAACKDEQCTPKLALAKVPKAKLKLMDVHLDELSVLLDQEVAKEKAKKEKAKKEQTRKDKAARKKAAREKDAADQAAAKLEAQEKAAQEQAVAEKKAQKKARQDQRNQERHVLKERERLEEVTHTMVKDIAAKRVGPALWATLSLVGLVILIFKFPAAGMPCFLLFLISELVLAPIMCKGAVRQIVSRQHIGALSSSNLSNLPFNIGMGVIAIGGVQLFVGIVTSVAFWMTEAEGLFINISKFVVPLGWKAILGFIGIATATAIVSGLWGSFHQSIRANQILRQWQRTGGAARICSMEWYYSKDGQQIGPVSEGELKGWLAKGSLSRDTLVWKEDMPQWQPAGQIFLVTQSL